MINLDTQLNDIIERVLSEKSNEILETIKNRFNYECSLFRNDSLNSLKKVNKGRTDMKLYDPDTAEMKTYKAYNWICDHVILIGEIERDGTNSHLKLYPQVSGDNEMDDFLKERFKDIFENVRKKTSYSFM